MRLLLVRHAPTAETGRRLSGRQAGIPLSPAGRQHAAALRRHLADQPVAAVYTSPVQRCRETAGEVAAAWGLRPTVDRAFIEVDYGAWTGRTLASLRRTARWGQLFIAPSRVRFPEGETLAEVQTRVVARCEALATRHPRDVVVAVSHGDVIKAALTHYLGSPLDLIQRLDVAPASFSTLDLPPTGPPRVMAINGAAPAGDTA